MTAAPSGDVERGRLSAQIRQLARYGIVGGLLTIVYLGVALFLSRRLGLSASIASPLSFVLCLPLVYVGQAVFVFRAPRGSHAQMVRFLITVSTGFIVSASVAPTLGNWFALPERASFLAVSILVPVSNFLIFRFWVFRAG